MSLEQAPDEVKLAVDLIMLLENHDIAPQTVLAALEIVRDDYLRKLRDAGQLHPSPQPAEKG
ncbi:pleiotropic regulatory protein RsmS [Cronobacter dublinensis]|uniref:pleiotropic regulatory protein RsmS n=1 Tax=Cronobacter dublinensis TaxID=413497 RepID=UPI000CFCA182|nr:pleiotropic regulatory protein RsmS [Cronobacter dublinensis]